MITNFYGISEKGNVRIENQDSILMLSNKEFGIFVVADGMGGHSHGGEASKIITNRLNEWWENNNALFSQNSFQDVVLSVQNALKDSNNFLFNNYNVKNQVCGSTAVILVIFKNFYGIINIGDSRCYILNKRCFKLETKDDIWENQTSLYKYKLLKKHPNCGKLVNAVGIHQNLYTTVKTDVLNENTLFLLCSDGLYKQCNKRLLKKKMQAAYKKDTLIMISNGLFNIVQKKGAKDNVSFILVEYSNV